MESELIANMLKKAFTMGFMISREGYNWECPYEWLAPNSMEEHYKSEGEFLIKIENYSEFLKLRDDAINMVLKASGGDK